MSHNIGFKTKPHLQNKLQNIRDNLIQHSHTLYEQILYHRNINFKYVVCVCECIQTNCYGSEDCSL